MQSRILYQSSKKNTEKQTNYKEVKKLTEPKIENNPSEEKKLEELLFDSKIEKYKLVPLAARWAKELKNKEEYKYLTFNELLELSLKDILSGKVSPETISKLPDKTPQKKQENIEKIETKDGKKEKNKK